MKKIHCIRKLIYIKKNLFKLSDENKKLKEKMSMIENTKINNNNYNNYNFDKKIYMKIKDYDTEIKEIKKKIMNPSYYY